MWKFLARVQLLFVIQFLTPAFAQDDALTELGKQYEAQQQRYRDAIKTATTAEERLQVFIKQDPRNSLLNDFLAMARDHRREPAGISALYQLMRNAISVGDPDYPSSQGRIEAIEIAERHYIDHPDLDLLFPFFEAGAFVPEAERFLRSAQTSPHDHVRAAAKFHLASFLQHKANLVEIVRDEVADAKDDVSEHRRKFHEQILALEPIDLNQVREEAVRLVTEVFEESRQLARSYARTEGPGGLSVRRIKPEEINGEPSSYGDAAESLRFELTNLQVGQTAPDIVGADADGTEFKLTDYRGRVVLLMFSADWCGPCKAMYPELHELQNSLSGEPFSILAVMGDGELKSVVNDIESGDIRWRTWFDGRPGPIATRWNVNSWPTLYLLDHKGVIANNRPGSSFEDLREEIDKLLSVRAEDPEAEELLAAHPLPGLPILERGRKIAQQKDRIRVINQFTVGTDNTPHVAFDPAGQFSIVGYYLPINPGEDTMEAWKNGRVRTALELWDAELQERLGGFAGECGAIESIAISPDARFVATGGRQLNSNTRGHLALWDVEKRTLVRLIGQQRRRVLSLSFSPDGTLLASGGFDSSPKIWNVSSGDEIAVLDKQPGALFDLDFVSGRGHLIVPSARPPVSIWETESWTKLRELEFDGFSLQAVSTSRDGQYFAAAGWLLDQQHENRLADGGRTFVWELESGDVKAEIATSGGLNSVSFSADGRLLATAGIDKNVAVWDWMKGEMHAFVPLSRRSSNDTVQFMPSGNRLVHAATGGRVTLYEVSP